MGSGVLPPWPPTYSMPASTILMACSYSGFLNISAVSRYKIVDIDWSNGKELWANDAPMTCEESMLEQVALIKAASPTTRVWLYKNLIKALPWITSVREKLLDPAFSGFFLPFDPQVTTPHVPPCDHSFSPPKCSALYHDQTQSPQFPTELQPGGGNCSAPCDCGPGLPCGEYIFNHANGSQLRSWLLDEYVMGPTGMGNPNVTGLYLDDGWSSSGPGGNITDCSRNTIGGPTEVNPFCVADMGLTQADTQAQQSALGVTNSAVSAAVRAAGGFTWAYLTQASTPPKAAGPEACAAWFRTKGPSLATLALAWLFQCPWCGLSEHDSRAQDLAAFLLVRGPYAWIGQGWLGLCDGVMANPVWYPPLDVEYGAPLTDFYNETSPGSGVFNRSYEHAWVGFDCGAYEGSIVMKA